MRRLFLAPAAIALAAFAAGCADPAPAPVAHVPAAPQFAAGAQALLVCPSSGVDLVGSFMVDRRGGGVAVGGSSIVIPPRAVSRPTQFVFTVPASRYMEVEIHAVGYDHFVFKKPVTVTIDYSRCSGPAASKPLTAWYIDGDTKTPLEQMDSRDLKEYRRVVFETGHLSGYALLEN